MSRRLLALFTLALGLTACRAAPRVNGDVVLITVDTLRADHVGLYGYERPTTPNIDSWFEEGLVYERAYSAASYTTPSVISLLTGLLPVDHGVRGHFDRPREGVLLAPELLPSSYQTAAFVSNVLLTDETLGIGGRFDHYDDRIELAERTGRYDRDARETTDAALSWLETVDADRPVFLWIHYMDPHAPYLPPAHWGHSFTSSEPTAGTLGEPTDQVDLYDEEIAYTDSEIGRLVAALEKRRGLDGALLVLTSDHGESLTERWIQFNHGFEVFEELVHVPLLIRPGGQPGVRHSVPVSAVDILPTVLGFAGAAHADLPGSDLRSAPPGRPVPLEAFFFGHQFRAIVDGTLKFKIVRHHKDPPVTRRLFFDLDRDPGEKHPSTGWPEGDNPAAERLLELTRRDRYLPQPPSSLRHDQLELLRGLGYVE